MQLFSRNSPPDRVMALVIQSCNREMYTVVSKFPGKTWRAAHVQTGAPFVFRPPGSKAMVKLIGISPPAAFASIKEHIFLQSTMVTVYNEYLLSLYKTAIIKCHNWIENHHGPACSSTYEYLLDVA